MFVRNSINRKTGTDENSKTATESHRADVGKHQGLSQPMVTWWLHVLVGGDPKQKRAQILDQMDFLKKKVKY